MRSAWKWCESECIEADRALSNVYSAKRARGHPPAELGQEIDTGKKHSTITSDKNILPPVEILRYFRNLLNIDAKSYLTTTSKMLCCLKSKVIMNWMWNHVYSQNWIRMSQRKEMVISLKSNDRSAGKDCFINEMFNVGGWFSGHYWKYGWLR